MWISNNFYALGQRVWYDRTIQHQTQTYTQHFLISSSSFNQIEQFLCHWNHKLEFLFLFLNIKSKGEREITQEEKEENCDILSKFF